MAAEIGTATQSETEADRGAEGSDTAAAEIGIATQSESGADRGAGGSDTEAAVISIAAPSAPGQVRSSANNTDGSSRTREVAYLRHGPCLTLAGREQAEVIFGNHYFGSQCGVSTAQQVSASNSKQCRNVRVECGSTHCEFEIKVYEIKASSYAMQ